MYGIFAAALIAGLVTMLVTPAMRRLSEKTGAVDKPEARRVNTTDMPRLGGVAIFAGFLVAVIITIAVRQFAKDGQHTWTLQVTGVLLAVAFIAVTSLIDDLTDLSAKWQALSIIAAALILAAFGVRIEGITNPFGGAGTGQNWHALPIAVSILLTVFWVFTVTKTVDAIDGVDGLAAGVCAISAATLALMATQVHALPGAPSSQGPTVALIAAAICGACLGFLRHNYHPAKIIMGTVGAQVLGLALAAVSIMGAFKVAAAVSVLIPLLVLGVPIFDFTHVMARRIIDRAPLTKADRRHMHHRLLDRGWDHKQVAWLIYSLTIVLCITALALFRAGHGGR